MNKPTSEKTWRDLDDAGKDHFFKLLNERAKNYGTIANTAWLELEKYLFATNTGAAAGMFLLTKANAQANAWCLAAFGMFCARAFFVGVSFFTFAENCHQIAQSWARDAERVANSELTFGELDKRHGERFGSKRAKFGRLSLRLSFAALICGGIVAGFAVWNL